MRVTGYVNKQPLHILLDNGSTHNILDIQITKKFGCLIEERDPLLVIVADGNKIKISSVVKKFVWRIQQTTFTYDVLLIPLGCCDLVLGVEWLVLGDYVWIIGILTKIQLRTNFLFHS